MKTRFLLYYLLCFPLFLSAQNGTFSVGIGTGIGAGWWVYDKGLTDTLPTIHRGYDRTHLAVIWPVEGTIQYSLRRWTIGLGIDHRYLDDRKMVASEDARGRRRKYIIGAEGRSGIPIRHAFLQGQYYLIQNDRLWLGAQVRIGIFDMIHNHPRASTFRLHLSQEVGLVHLIPLNSHFALCIRPQFSNFRIWTAGGFEGERHNIYTLSGVVGLRFAFHSSSP